MSEEMTINMDSRFLGATKLFTKIIHLDNMALQSLQKHVLEGFVILVLLHRLFCSHHEFCWIVMINHHLSAFHPLALPKQTITLDLFAFIVHNSGSDFLHRFQNGMLLAVGQQLWLLLGEWKRRINPCAWWELRQSRLIQTRLQSEMVTRTMDVLLAAAEVKEFRLVCS